MLVRLCPEQVLRKLLLHACAAERDPNILHMDVLFFRSLEEFPVEIDRDGIAQLRAAVFDRLQGGRRFTKPLDHPVYVCLVSGTNPAHSRQSFVFSQLDFGQNFHIDVNRDWFFTEPIHGVCVIEMNVRFANQRQLVFIDSVVDCVRYKFTQDLAAYLALEARADHGARRMTTPKARHAGLLCVAIADAVVSCTHNRGLNFNLDLLACRGDINQFCLHQT